MTTELDKLKAAAEALGTEHVGAFLDWFLHERKGQLYAWRDATPGVPCPHAGKSHGDLRSGGPTCPECGTDIGGYPPRARRRHQWLTEPLSEGFYPLALSIEDLLAEYAGIDRKAVDAERRALLTKLQERTP